jgi:hypothetical protein
MDGFKVAADERPLFVFELPLNMRGILDVGDAS